MQTRLTGAQSRLAMFDVDFAFHRVTIASKAGNNKLLLWFEAIPTNHKAINRAPWKERRKRTTNK